MANKEANSKTGKNKIKSTKPLKNTRRGKIKAHHAKSFRKRHYGALMLSLGLLIGFSVWFVSARASNSSISKGAKNLLSDIFNSEDSAKQSTVNSSYGFSLQYDPISLSASASDSSGGVYVGEELQVARNYDNIKFSPGLESVSLDSMSVSYYAREENYQSPEDVEENLITGNDSFSVVSSSNIQVRDLELLKTEWEASVGANLSGIKSKRTTFSAVLKGHPFVAVIEHSIAAPNTSLEAYLKVIDSLRTSNSNPSAKEESSDSVKKESRLGAVLDGLTFTKTVDATTLNHQPSNSELISTLYGPSVVKIYNLYCMDISLDGALLASNLCRGVTGTGFLVGSQGHVATNGHVAANDPLDIAITKAFDDISNGDSAIFDALANKARITQSEVDSAPSQAEKLALIVNKLYAIPKSSVKATNNIENILVSLSEEVPDIQQLRDDTRSREKYSEGEFLKRATLIDSDYRTIDGTSTGAFKASDVALLKVDLDNHPAVALGGLESLSQGSEVNIIGYPGMASNNGLVEVKQSRATLTYGRVSSIKNAIGSDNQLIETDATIGQGNSGGPVFNTSGEVVGIATYTADGGGEGRGTFNYARDISDFKALASKASVDVVSLSSAQQTWVKGVKSFYEGKYSDAISKLGEAKSAYPGFARADQLIDLATQRQSSGEEVNESKTLLLALGVVLFAVVSGVCVVVIVLHKKKHKAYLASQQTQPAQVAPQQTQPPSPPLTPSI